MKLLGPHRRVGSIEVVRERLTLPAKDQNRFPGGVRARLLFRAIAVNVGTSKLAAQQQPNVLCRAIEVLGRTIGGDLQPFPTTEHLPFALP
jgi:hypothetical protein